MPVTDLTDSLPWWAQQGGAPGGGQQPPGNGAGWLQYLSQMYGISPQQAATMMQSGGNPADMPSPDASNMSMVDLSRANGAPFKIPGQDDAPAVTAADQPPPPYNPLSGGSANTGVRVRTPTPPGPTTMPARPAGVSATGLPLSPGSLSPASLAAFNAPVPWRGPLAGDSPANTAWAGGDNPDAPAANARPIKGPLATGGAGGMGATSNPRFTMIDRPNAPAGGSPYGRGGPPQMSALNLAGLFGGGPRGGPAAAPMGTGGGGAGYQVSAPGAAATQQGLDYTGQNFGGPGGPVRGPLANRPLPPAVARARMLQPNYYS